MSKRLLDYDPFTGVSTWHDMDGDKSIIAETSDVESAVEYAKAKAGSEQKSREGKKKGWWHVATIPVGVQYKWLRDHGVNIFDKNHKAAVERLLNSPEYRYLRTAHGRI